MAEGPAAARRDGQDPTSTLRLRWGSSRGRVAGGFVLIVGGGAAIAGSNTFTLLLALAGVLAHLAGWSIMPSAGWRRVVASLGSTVAMVGLLGGPQFLGVLVIPYIGWLLVRHRPARSYPTLTFVLAAAIIVARIFTVYAHMLLALGIVVAVMVASAWAARALSSRG
ncbi:hypothetical protein BH11ACT3_BH11ACT3_14940 [soil metagenome]